MNLNNRIGKATPAELIVAPPDPFVGFTVEEKQAVIHGSNYLPQSAIPSGNRGCAMCNLFAKMLASGKIQDGIHFNNFNQPK